MQFLDNFGPLADKYDGFILDLWGVIHDGVTAYPHSAATLQRLRDAGKKCVLLSNAPRRSFKVQEAMRKMGIADDLYHGILTSGEATYIMLKQRTDPWYAGLGTRVFHLGPDRDKNVMDGLGLTEVFSPTEADFFLNTGPDDQRDPTTLTDFEPILADCLKAGLKMVCANPDLEVISNNRRMLCAGALAVRYQELGGDMRMLGKPDKAVYSVALDMLGVPPARVLGVGDALRTDIAGATNAGLDSCWVLGGIHAEELGGDQNAIRAAAASVGLAPIAVVPSFTW